MKKNYIKPTAKLNRTFTGEDLMAPVLTHSYDVIDAKERDLYEDNDDEIGERPNEYGIEPMSLW